MGFREFITNRLYRRRQEQEFEKFQNIKPPDAPKPKYIAKLVKRLLDEDRAWDARRELEMIGQPAVDALAAALGDQRYHEPEPLDVVLELLVPHGGEHVVNAAMQFVDSPSDALRKTAALHLASVGRTETIPTLDRLLQDPDGYVRSYTAMGIGRAVAEGRASDAFRRQAYDLLLAQCDQDWGIATNDAADVVVAIDPNRAAIDFADERWFALENKNTHRILKSCNDAKIAIPESIMRSLYDRAVTLAVGERCYPYQYVAAEALTALGLHAGERARPLLEDALKHEQADVQAAAATGIARLAGVHDPVGFVLERMQTTGLKGLSHEQRVVYFAFVFDAEVSNGGIMQFFGNSGGGYAADTLEALRTLGHPAAEAALAMAMKQAGPLSREPDRDMRLAAFEGRYDQLQSIFDPLERAYYRTSGRLRQQWLLYAARHPEHFKAT